MLSSQKISAQGAEPQTPGSKVAQRLLVHARLCRQLASASLDEAVGEQLLKLASECVREAAETLAAERVADRTDGEPETWRPDTA